eukprot:1095891-Prymnesium_polylepis.1
MAYGLWPMAYGAPCGGNGRYARTEPLRPRLADLEVRGSVGRDGPPWLAQRVLGTVYAPTQDTLYVHHAER